MSEIHAHHRRQNAVGMKNRIIERTGILARPRTILFDADHLWARFVGDDAASRTGYEIQHFSDPKTGRIRSHNYNLDYIFAKGITWTALSSGNFGCRYSDDGKLADSKGSMLYLFDKDNVEYFLALLNSAVSKYVLGVTSQTLDFKPGRVAEIPVIISEKETVIQLAKKAVIDSKADWDSYETSWDFKRNPLV